MQEKLSPESRGARAVVAIRDSLDDEDWQALNSSFPGLSDAGLEALRDELASEPPPVMGGASFADVEAFRELPEARALLSEWAWLRRTSSPCSGSACGKSRAAWGMMITKISDGGLTIFRAPRLRPSSGCWQDER